MPIEVRRTDYASVESMRELYRHELNCQIVHYSFLARGLADPYSIFLDDHIAGYGAVANKYDKGRVVECYILPEVRHSALKLYREFLEVSAATHIEAQTNSSLMLQMLYDCAKNIRAEKILFHDASITYMPSPGGTFRRATPQDQDQTQEQANDWVIEADGAIVAKGGFLCHYNPPYGDIYMEVKEEVRNQGFGSFFVQELKRVCYEAGKKPAARCNVDNSASRRTLEKAGLLPCGHMLVGKVRPVSDTVRKRAR